MKWIITFPKKDGVTFAIEIEATATSEMWSEELLAAGWVRKPDFAPTAKQEGCPKHWINPATGRCPDCGTA